MGVVHESTEYVLSGERVDGVGDCGTLRAQRLLPMKTYCSV
jgi:hypothetical protein